MEEAHWTPRVNQQPAPRLSEHEGVIALEVDELSHIELPLGATSGYLLAGDQPTQLPIGSTLRNGTFYWQLGPGFLGDYTLLFERPNRSQVRLIVRVGPGVSFRSQPTQ
jgi:hypothetical protein